MKKNVKYRNNLIKLFLLIVFISTFIYTVVAQENETKEIIQQKNNISVLPNASYLISEADVLIEAQRSLDRSINILEMVATLIGVLVGLITLIVIIAIASGIFEFNKWKAIRKDLEKEANIIKDIRNKAEIDVQKLRSEVLNIPFQSLNEKLSEESNEKIEELRKKSEFLDILGASLKSEDYYNIGHDFYNKKEYDKAIKAIEKAIELKPDYAEAWDAKGATLLSLKIYEKALEAFEKAIDLKPNYANAWDNKGAALSELGKNDEAIKAIEKAIELNPTLAKAWDNKGVTLFRLGKNDEAIKAIEKAIELAPSNSHAWFNLSCFYSTVGDKEKTLSNLEKAIEINESFKELAKFDKDFKNFWDDDDFKKLLE